jgi:serine protease Do
MPLRNLPDAPVARHHSRTLTAAALLWLGLAGFTPALRADGPELATAPAPAAGESQRKTALVRMIERVRPAVVNIHSERTVAGGVGEDGVSSAAGPNRVNGMGTGIVIDPRGYIVTNHHVVDDVQVLRVRLADGGLHTARVVARDPGNDLALMKIEPGKALQTMPLGTAQDLMVGEDVVAIGNAYGYEHSTTRGIVSAIKRDVSLNKDLAYKSLIQTDASINPGNSGGPLLNVNGELVGVNVAIRAGAQGIGFAIPVDTMIRVTADMLRAAAGRAGGAHGLVVRDRVDGTDPVRRSLVVERADGAAASAGLQAGDVLVRVGDARVATTLDLERAMLDRRAGERVAIAYKRDAEEKTATLSLAADAGSNAAELIWRKLGVRMTPVSAEVVRRYNPQLHGGLALTEVRPDGAAGRAGLQTGDVLIGLHNWETLSGENVVFVVTHPDLAQFSPLRFFIVRGGQVRRGHLGGLE